LDEVVAIEAEPNGLSALWSLVAEAAVREASEIVGELSLDLNGGLACGGIDGGACEGEAVQLGSCGVASCELLLAHGFAYIDINEFS
jgi:hypothetical protein